METIVNRRLLLLTCTALTLLFASTPAGSRAQEVSPALGVSSTQPGPFSDVPAGTWPFAAGETLQKAGIPFDCPYQGGTYGGRRETTRYEFAVAVVRVTPFLAPEIAPTTHDDHQTPTYNDIEQRLQQSLLAQDALTTLVIEFTPELRQLGQNVELIQSHLYALRQSVAKPIPGQAARASDELQIDSWPYAAITAINKDGVPFGYHMGDGALNGQMAHLVQSGLTRYEFAVNVARILPLIEVVGTPLSPERPFYLPAALRDATLPVIDSSRRDLESKMRHDTVLIDALRALLNEFRPELLQLHTDVSPAMSRLNTLKAVLAAEESGPRRRSRQNVPPRSVRATPFPDVPPNHWAFSAVEALRQSGIVVGYPMGASRTDNGQH